MWCLRGLGPWLFVSINSVNQKDAKDASTEGRRLVRALLDVDPLTVDVLLTVAHDVLGPERAEHCVRQVRGGRLTRRSYLLAEVAAVVVGTRHLGVGWWARPHRRADKPGQWQQGPPPDEVLISGVVPSRWQSASVLEVLAWWSADDVADTLWGPPVDFVDLNSTRPTDRIALPRDARPGDRLVAAFDPGSRVDADVARRADGTLGSELDITSCRHSPPAEASWGWAIATGNGPHRLPDESPGSPADPYAVPIDLAAAETIRGWALQHGASPAQVGQAWKTASDVIVAIGAVDWMRRPDGRWWRWERAASALADRDVPRLAKALAGLAKVY